MMDFLTSRKYPRSIKPLQLTALIDVFSIIVIFLVLSSIFGVSDVKLPKGLFLPLSGSRESSVSAPSLSIQNALVEFGPLSESLPLDIFVSDEEEKIQKKAEVVQKLTAYIKKIPPEAKSSGVLLNVIADRDLVYGKIYDVLSVFRLAGFDTLMFVATAEGTAR